MTGARSTRLALAALLAPSCCCRSWRARERPRPRSTAAHETLIVITASNESIRYEFGRAFRAHMAGQGRNVDIDWRCAGRRRRDRAHAGVGVRGRRSNATGGEDLHRRWTGEIAAGFSRPAPDGATGDVADARRAFLASDVGAGIDVLFGGGSPEFIKHAAAGRLVDVGDHRAPPRAVRAGRHPGRDRAARRFWDRDGRWVGACLSSFGICYNRDALARIGCRRAAQLVEHAGRARLPRPARARRSDQELDQRQGDRDDRPEADDRRARARRGARRQRRRGAGRHRDARRLGARRCA